MLGGPLWNNVLILDKGTWEDVHTAASAIRDRLVTQLLGRHVVPVTQGLEYWKNLNWGVYWVQTLPFRLLNVNVRGIKNAFAHIVEKAPDSLYLKLLYGWRTISALISAPVARDVRTNVERLEKEFSFISFRVGELVSAESTEDLLDRLYSVANIPQHQADGTPEEAVIKLQGVLDYISDDKGARSCKPLMAVRWWPAWALFAISTWYITGSWQDFLNWLDVSVLETFKDFWRNWILEPLYRIYLVIRHDPNGRVALMARGSLESDVASLERMITEFVADTNPGADVSSVGSAVRSGDMTPVLLAYERQISHPILPLLKGELLRTLLIQVQKTKVDAEVALSGIDNLLESQQLVFGLVAALPALAVAWATVSALLKNILGAPIRLSRVRRLRKAQFLARLGNIDAILDKSDAQLGFEAIGAIWCEVSLLRRDIDSSDFSSERRAQLLNDLDRLLTIRQQSQALTTMDRIYIKYG